MSAYDLPDKRGHFGDYGGIFVSETLMQPLKELREAYERLRKDKKFQKEFADDLRHYVGRPSPLYLARRLTDNWGGAKIYLKREDLNHTGAHTINNTFSHARLGDQRREHLLYHRHRRRAASVSDDGARFPERDRPRDT